MIMTVFQVKEVMADNIHKVEIRGENLREATEAAGTDALMIMTFFLAQKSV